MVSLGFVCDFCVVFIPQVYKRLLKKIFFVVYCYQFHSNLREVMLYIKYFRDKEKLNQIIGEDPKFQSVERQAADVINVVTGSKLKYPEGKGVVNHVQSIRKACMLGDSADERREQDRRCSGDI